LLSHKTGRRPWEEGLDFGKEIHAMKMLNSARIYGSAVAILAIIGLVLVSVQVLVPFLGAIAWAVVLGVTFQPQWAYLQRRLPNRPNLSAALLTIAIGLLVLLPAAVMISIIASQINHLAVDIIGRLNAGNVRSFSDLIRMPWVSRVLDTLKDRAGMSPEDFQRLAASFLQRLSSVLPGLSARLAISLFDGLVTFMMSLFLLFFVFRDGQNMAQAALELLPLEGAERQQLGRSVSAMTRAIFHGSLLCALAQGILGGLGWWLAGLPLPTLAGAAMAILSLLPLGGTALIWVPGVIGAWSTGHHGAALFLTIWGTLVISFFADNILRPWLIRGTEQLSTLVVIIGVVGGMAAFGLLGVFIGPIALALAVSLLDLLRALALQSGQEQPPEGTL
jgi:predicted PurR-regulated permease PerM